MLTKYLAPTMNIIQIFAFVLLGLTALALLVATSLSAANILPWVGISATFGEASVVWAGPAVQIGFTALLLILVAYIPASYRVARLEYAHRKFEIDMDDVTKAYRAAHYADRAETFGMRREFDAIRERYKFLKTHPDLAQIDDDLLTIGAQMSEQTKALAETYSDRNLNRVRENLLQRREDADALEAKLAQIKADTAELELLRKGIGISDAELAARVASLQGALTEIEMPDAANDDPDDVYLKSMKH